MVFYGITALNVDDRIFSLHEISRDDACAWSDAETVTSRSRGYRKTIASPCRTSECWKLPEGYVGRSSYSGYSTTSQKEGIVSGQVVSEARVVRLPGDNNFSDRTRIRCLCSWMLQIGLEA